MYNYFCGIIIFNSVWSLVILLSLVKNIIKCVVVWMCMVCGCVSKLKSIFCC